MQEVSCQHPVLTLLGQDLPGDGGSLSPLLPSDQRTAVRPPSAARRPLLSPGPGSPPCPVQVAPPTNSGGAWSRYPSQRPARTETRE